MKRAPNKLAAAKLAKVLHGLELAYGRPQWKCWGKALDVLIETILSQNTSNANSSAGYKRLRRRFRTWSAAADAPVHEVEECIRISGLSNIKAPRIQAILRQIRQRRAELAAALPTPASPTLTPSPARKAARPQAPNAEIVHGITPGAGRNDAISLEYLRDMDPADACDHLLSFKGVGPKTAACVLLFSFHMPIFPVDTHIHRIAIRLGLADPKASPEHVQQTLTPLIPPADRYVMHILLIEHGRKTCRARSPRCPWCQLIDLCPYGEKQTKT